MAAEWAAGAALLFAVLTAARIYAADRPWQAFIPGGIAVAVGEALLWVQRPCVAALLTVAQECTIRRRLR